MKRCAYKCGIGRVFDPCESGYDELVRLNGKNAGRSWKPGRRKGARAMGFCWAGWGISGLGRAPNGSGQHSVGIPEALLIILYKEADLSCQFWKLKIGSFEHSPYSGYSHSPNSK